MDIASRKRPLAGFTALIMAALAMAAVVPAGAQEGPPECPAAPANAIVYELPFEELYSHRGPGASIGQTISVDLPAGVYDIRLTAWDDHVIGDEVKETQLREVYQIEGFFGGSVVFTSGETPDLPDNQNTITAIVNTAASVPQLDALRAVHSDPGQDETANSIHPICVAFIPVAQDTTTTQPVETTVTTETSTTTIPVETSSTSIATTTTQPTAASSTVPPEVSSTTIRPTTTGGTTDTLPFTGLGTDGLAVIAFSALVAGTGLVLLTRRSSDEA